MAVEDFSTYTEVDTPNRFTFPTTNRIATSGLTRNDNVYVYKDFGAAFFNGNFVHDITYNIGGGVSAGGVGYAWLESNTIANASGIEGAAGKYLAVAAVVGASTFDLYAIEFDGSSQATSFSPGLSFDTDYFLRIERDVGLGSFGHFILKIYSDSARTSLIDTRTIVLRSDEDFRYQYIASSLASGPQFISGYAEDLDLGLGGIVITDTLASITPQAIGVATGGEGVGIVITDTLASITPQAIGVATGGEPSGATLSGTLRDELTDIPIDCSLFNVFIKVSTPQNPGAAAASVTCIDSNGNWIVTGLLAATTYFVTFEFFGTFTPSGATNLTESRYMTTL